LITGATKDILKHGTVVLLCGSTLLCLVFPKSVYMYTPENINLFVSYCLQ